MAEDEIPVLTYQQLILVALNRLDKHIFSGTVPKKVIAQRRARNKVARVSRRNNRGRS